MKRKLLDNSNDEAPNTNNEISKPSKVKEEKSVRELPSRVVKGDDLKVNKHQIAPLPPIKIPPKFP